MVGFIRTNGFTLFGSTLIAVAGLGFLTVADDLHHVGELLAVLAVLLCGVCLLVAGLYPRWSTTLALQWAPPGILAGALVGAVADRVALGVLLGCGLGILLSRLRRARAT